MKRTVVGRSVIRWRPALAAVFLIALLVVLVATGGWPELRSKVSFSSKGLLTVAPTEIDRVEVRSGTDGVSLHRQPGGWSIDGMQDLVPAELASHLDTALRLLKVREPSREIPAKRTYCGELR